MGDAADDVFDAMWRGQLEHDEDSPMTTASPEEIVERLHACADDPMWADHAEIPKSWCREAADLIAALTARYKSLGGQLNKASDDLDYYTARYEAVCRERDEARHAAAARGFIYRDCEKHNEELQAKYQDEYAIVDRVWKALGVKSYDDAKGKAIDELVRDLSARADIAEAALATLRDKVRVLGEFAETTTEPNMVGVPAMVLTEALALLAPSGNGEKP